MKKPIPKRHKGVLLCLVLSALLVLFSMTASAMANTGATPEQTNSASFLQMMTDAKAGYSPTVSTLSPFTSYGYYNAGTSVGFTSHTSLYTYTYGVGYQVPVSALFENDNLTPGLECYFGVYDYDKGDYGEYIELYYVGDLTELQMIGTATIDTSGLTISKDRYSIDAIIYDPNADVEGDVDDYDEIGLNVKALSTPTISSAASSGVHSVKVSWNAQGGVTGYRVYKATSATGTYSYVGSTAMNTYNCTGLTTGKTYYFKVKAYCSGGEVAKYGSASAYKAGKPMPPTPSVTAVSGSYTSAKLSWKAISGATAYQIYRATSATGTYSYLKTTTSTSYTNTSLTTGKTYYYKVRAYHTESNGTKYYSSFCSYKAVKPVPATPKVVDTLGFDNTSVTISWPAIAGATKYEIYRNGTDPDSTYALVATVTSPANTWTDKGLPPNVAHSYKVRAYHLEGTTKVYGSFSIPVGEYTVGTPVLNVTPEVGGTSVTLTWDEMYAATKYEIYRSNTEGGFDLIATTGYSPRTYLDSDLTPSTEYTYKIRAYHLEETTNIYGAFSAEKTVTTSAPIVPGAPSLSTI